MRQLVFTALTAAVYPPEANAIESRIYAAGSLGVEGMPAKPQLPYMSIALGVATDVLEVRDTSTAGRIPLRIYVYDNRGSYTTIDEIHRVVRQTLEGLAGTVSPSGRRCTDIRRTTLSGDLVDQEQNLYLRIATYLLVAAQ